MILKKNSEIAAHIPIDRLLDDDLIGRAIWECLKNNDPQGVVEIIEAHLEAVNKSQFDKKTLSES